MQVCYDIASKLVTILPKSINMSRKTVKARSEDPFEKETGIRICSMIGGSECRITPMERTMFDGNQHRVKNIAASIYLNTPISQLGKVEQTCEVKNCVHPEHLTVAGHPLKLTPDGKVSAPELDMGEPENVQELEQYIINNSWGKTEEQIEELRASVYKNGIPK